MTPGPTAEEIPTSTFRLAQREGVIKTKLTELHEHQDMTGNPGLVNLNRFRFKPDPKGATFFEFYGDKNK